MTIWSKVKEAFCMPLAKASAVLLQGASDEDLVTVCGPAFHCEDVSTDRGRQGKRIN